MENIPSLSQKSCADISNQESSTSLQAECSCSRYCQDLRVFNTKRLFEVIEKKQSEQDIINDIDACLKNGANINAPDDSGNTVLNSAVQKNYLSLVEFLVGQGGVIKDSAPTSGAAGSAADITIGSSTPRPLDAPSVSNECSNTNTIELNFEIDKRFTDLIIDKNLKFSCENYIELLETLTNDSYNINDKLNWEPYPSDRTLALLALKAYSDNPDDETRQKLPKGWELLTTARNLGWTNGYFGAAFWCRALQQVVVAHRGTQLTNTGAVWTDLNSVVWNKLTSHVCSAVTFTEAIATALNEVKKEGVRFQLSFTGHSLGGWLAQVTAFTVKYLQKDKSTFRKMDNIRDGIHAHTVTFDSPGCKKMLSKIKENFDLKYERLMILKRLDITSYLSAPNMINTINLHLGTVYRIITELSNVTYMQHTSVTHSMENMLRAMEEPSIFRMLDWPLTREEYNEFFESATPDNKFHLQTFGYVFKESNRNGCNLRIFSEDELLLLDLWTILIKSKMNLTNLIKIKDLPVSDLFDKFLIDKEKQTIECSSEESIKKVIRHTKALMRWIPGEAVTAAREQAALVPSAAEAMFRAEGDSYVRYLKQSRVDFRDTIELETFLISGNNILIIRTSDSDLEMARIVKIFHQIKKKWDYLKETNNHYAFMDLKGIKRLESAVNIKELFQSCFAEDYLFIIQCTENYDNNFETILNEILTNLTNNTNNKLVFVETYDTDFENFVNSFHLSLEIDNNYILKHTEEIKLNDLTEESMKTIFEEKIIFLQGELFSLRELVGKYRHLTVDQLNNVNTLIGPQMLKNLLTIDNYVVEIEETILNNDDLHVHSTLNTKVCLARVARVLPKHSRDALLVISGIGREELETDGWRELAHGLGEERIFTTTSDGESVFRKQCREKPCATVYWFSASAQSGVVRCKTVYKKEFYIERKFHKILFNFEKFAQQADVHSAIFVFKNIKRSLMSQLTISEGIKMVTSAEEAIDIIEKNPDNAVHILKQEANDGPILWQHSRGSLEDLRPYVTADIGEPIDEEELRNTSRKVVIIADEPGMGKSTSLTSMSRLLRSAWVIRVDLKEFQIPIHNLPTELSLNSVCEFILKGKGSLLHRLLRLCLDKEHENSRVIYIFFDGFDEIKQDSSSTTSCAEEGVLRLLKYLNNETTARIWVTTRLHRKEMLENALSVFALQFKRISESQQREYLVKFWRPHLLLELDNYGHAEERKLERCADYLFKNAKNVLGDDIQTFMGIPLQMRMLAETFKQRVKVYIESEAESETDIGNTFDVKSVLDLYQQFIRLKCDIYLSDKTGLNAGMSREIKQSNVELITEKHRLLGLRTLFPDFAKDNFGDPEDEWGVELCRIGLVQSGGDGRENIEFIHRTLAEYFCADLAVDWLRRKGRYHGHAPLAGLLLTEILLRDSHNVIRIFINNLVLSQPLCENAYEFSALKISELWCDRQHFLFNRLQQTALHVAVEEGNTGIIDILVGGLKCKPTQNGLTAFVAALNQNGHTALGLAARNSYNRNIMKRIVQSVETCPYEVLLELLLATYIRYRFLLADEIKLLTNYLEHETVCSEIKKAFTRTKTMIQKEVPPFLGAVNGSKTKDVDVLYRKMENNTERHYMLLASAGEVGTALHIAARSKNNEERNKIQIEIIRILCNHYIPGVGRSYDSQGQTPLHRAAEAGHLDIVEHFVHYGVYIDSLSSDNGETALFPAVRRRGFRLVKYLVEMGSDINILNKDGETALFSAVTGGSLRLVEYLVEEGTHVNVVNKRGETVLFCAVDNGHLPMVKYLVEKGSDINILKNDGTTVLFSAVHAKNLPVVEYLIEEGAHINVLDKNDENVLFFAIRSGSDLVVEHLVEKGVDVNTLNKDGKNVLFDAARSGNYLMVNRLVEKGVDINILDRHGENVLFSAVHGGNHAVVDCLIDNGVDISIMDQHGMTALEYACTTNRSSF